MSETSEIPEDVDDDENLPPRIWSKGGESRIPADIWDAACETVRGFRSVEDSPAIGIDADDFLRTMIATAVYMERQKARN